MKDTPIEFVTNYKYHTDNNKCWGSIFFCNYDGDIKIQEEEIDEYKWESIENIQNSYIGNKDLKVTPDSALVFKMLVDHYPKLLRLSRLI